MSTIQTLITNTLQTESSLPIIPSVQAFMTDIIDYAGLFPPAKLPLAEAFKNYVQYVQGGDRWMLSHFIISVNQLEALSSLLPQYTVPPTPFLLSVLGRASTHSDTFLKDLALDLQIINNFQQQHQAKIMVDMFEGKLPTDLIPNTDKIHTLLLSVAELFREGFKSTKIKTILPFYEVMPASNWHKTAEATIKAMAAYNQNPNQTLISQIGFKLRCGGVEAAAFPSTARVAFIIAACRDANIPLKATAGLHHPIRHFNETVQTKMHGFINVFGSALLAYQHHLDEAQIKNILEDETSTHFKFDNNGFGWQDLTIANSDIVNLRQKALISYGSCSFDEPREDLKQLNLL